ncbi:polyadenylate-binding protein-interacting protein 2B isoform X2 [Syngnathoides biaculeatus]|uniref:polyadenylate-binding protein-interacting protein 2B isoform X2 n=1 Tax=Syngnathoides biaculeatus TaxID=300417 RepID=UPI002ADE92C7|nr:polyadenylate-binding protein-interacting protein 2B isoform X2 [Syngnathoides biaculeatus]
MLITIMRKIRLKSALRRFRGARERNIEHVTIAVSEAANGLELTRAASRRRTEIPTEGTRAAVGVTLRWDSDWDSKSTMPEPAEMSGPEVAKSPGGGAPGKEGKEPVANGHAGDANDANPFAEYMWMENEEEYNRQVEEELLEQEFLERCFQEMLEEEDQHWFIPSRDLNNQGVEQLQQQLNGLSVNVGEHRSNLEEVARKSILNPEAKEFVPGKKY